MKFYTGRKFIVFVMAACIAFSLVFTMVAAMDCREHDCIGEGCPVCLWIETVECFLKTLKQAGIGLLLAVCSLFTVQIYKKYAEFTSCFLSPVLLKVRFNS